VNLRSLEANELNSFAIDEQKGIAIDDLFDPGGLGISGLRRQGNGEDKKK